MPHCKTWTIHLRLVSVIILSIIPVISNAAFYKYTDSNGVIHFLDDPAKIPRQYFEKIKTYDSGTNSNNKITNIRIVGNQVLIPATLGYDNRSIEVTLLLDTGASVTAVNSNMFAGMNLDHAATLPVKARVADGSVVTGRAVRVDYIEVGPNRIPDLYVALITHKGSTEDHDGLLGMNFLRSCEYRIDFDKQQILWK